MEIDVFEGVTQKETGWAAAEDMAGPSAWQRLLLAITLAGAPLYGMAGDVTYSSTTDTTQTVEQGASSLPFTFTATSPTLPATGNPKQTPYEQYGYITADYIAKDLTYTYIDPNTNEPVTVPFDFSSWFSITPLSFAYTGPMAGPEVSATVAVPGQAPVGMYTAKLVAKAANGLGWGEAAGVHITLNVVEPSATDTTPPVVSIIEPALVNGAPQNFVLGNRVPVDFTAIDLESPVSAWTADLLPGPVDISSLLSVNAISNGIGANGLVLSAVPGGSETIQVIGQYTLQVTATSDGGTSAPASRLFNVNYNVSPIAPDLTQGSLVWDKSVNNQGKCSASQHGTMQVKFEARAVQPADTYAIDNSIDAFVDDESVRVRIVRDSDQTSVLERIFGSSNASAVAISGATGDASGSYFTKVDLCSLPTGNYTIKVFFRDHSGNDFLQYSKPFLLQD